MNDMPLPRAGGMGRDGAHQSRLHAVRYLATLPATLSTSQVREKGGA